jgi:hypothetical protein
MSAICSSRWPSDTTMKRQRSFSCSLQVQVSSLLKLCVFEQTLMVADGKF